jgi:transposase
LICRFRAAKDVISAKGRRGCQWLKPCLRKDIGSVIKKTASRNSKRAIWRELLIVSRH